MKNWLAKAVSLLHDSLKPVPQELNEIDWKVDLSDNNAKLSHHLSAFANHPGGGFMVFGIDNSSGHVVGIDKNKADLILSRLSNLSRDTLQPPVQLDHAVETFEKYILMVFIQESSVKPVHLKSGTLEDCYIRSGGTTRRASRHEIGSLMLNSKSLRWEELHASKLLNSDSVLDLIDYEKICELLEQPKSRNNDEILEWLQREKMIKHVNEGFYITNFGAVSAAKNINHFDDLSRKAIRVIKYKGYNKLKTEQEIPGRKGYAVGFSGLIDYLKALLPQSEVIKNALRHETTVYPEIALRELIANALIHQDFTIMGSGPMIEIYDDRIEIRNPGKLLPSKKIDRLIGTNPESRNEILASAMRRYRICEERGTGFIKAVSAIELFGLPPLEFEQGENYFKVTMYSPRKFSDMSSADRVEASYQHAQLKYLSSDVLTNTSLRERFQLNEKARSMVSRVIKDAIEIGKIKPKDPLNKSVKFAEYVPYWA